MLRQYFAEDFMQPILIFRFSQTEGPGYLSHFLDREGLPWTQRNVDAGDAVPKFINGYAGLILMGGPMSVNDDLPWIPPVLELIRQAIASDVPVLGHCLGGQLMSRALGGTVSKNPVKEIGWGTVRRTEEAADSDWFAELPPEIEVFQWHGETFSLPHGARRLLTGDYCENQAFLVNDRHLALQCHVEMTDTMIRAWCETGAGEIRDNLGISPAVQSAGVMQENAGARLERLHHVADTLYRRWARGPRRAVP